jgi:hypothetical protein
MEKKKFGNTYELVEGFCFAIYVTRLNQPSCKVDDGKQTAY